VDAAGRAGESPATALAPADTLVGVSAAVAARIRHVIEERGPISFDEFMDLALYGPGGFYDRPPVGREGHFLTSPHVHPVFAEFLLRAVLDLRDGLGGPEPLHIVEVGAGDGTLAANLLRLLDERGGPAVDYAVVERSSGARAALAHLPVRVIERMGDAAHPDAMVVVANELLDNLPFRRVRGTRDGAVEIRIDADREGFVEVDAKFAKLAAEQGPLAPDQEVIVPIGAMGFVDELATTLHRGYALLIDYGSVRGPSSDVHGYREHRVLEDVLRDPGSADITAGVDFGSIVRRAERGGLRSLGLASQRDALLALGFAEWNSVQLDRQGSLLARGEGGPATRVWEGRGRAGLLVDPGGLGRQKWLLLATADLTPPAWLVQALADRRPTGG
jgi:SAM-dependent MidA family methyltransferase